MKNIVLLSYLATINGVLIYIYYRLCALKIPIELPREELNQEEEFMQQPLSEEEYHFLRNIIIGVFFFFGFYLWALIGTAWGYIARAMVTPVSFQEVVYFLFFFCMALIFFQSHQFIHRTFSIGKIKERGVFMMVMLTLFGLSIYWNDWVSVVFDWPVRWLPI